MNETIVMNDLNDMTSNPNNNIFIFHTIIQSIIMIIQYSCYLGIAILLIPFVGIYSFDVFLYLYRLLQYLWKYQIYKGQRRRHSHKWKIQLGKVQKRNQTTDDGSHKHEHNGKNRFQLRYCDPWTDSNVIFNKIQSLLKIRLQLLGLGVYINKSGSKINNNNTINKDESSCHSDDGDADTITQTISNNSINARTTGASVPLSLDRYEIQELKAC
ncbi:Irc23p NDAI_0F00720 [Naumovozyma dairenensis CBS 421]|uniref:Uncharacterized protein n=1 Tax=Naumovozyma dairenensis (strain ATCC 10597 / BCRC 20456 / CBS 421 / NBRC 0211 / NRRL Y-12639) TaxID=1071378 RepID=G0WC80_NAUDC|nr:hypothetical protein NDAI_0F00720 [Naumovozyma dairenensis CBS 421]CCD25391.1 hypothetical protein NDAI_0F00720 [Naumovozyma dairenensis CBS 421]